MSYALIRTRRLDLDSFAAVAGVHPELVRRLVTLDVLSASRDPSGTLWLGVSELAALGRAQRLRAAFGLNYAALGLVTDLLDRISVLETALRQSQRPGE